MTGAMRAAVYRGDRKICVEELPIPDLLPGELLVRVNSCGVCGTDLKKIEYGLVEPPRVFGHETAGTVCAVGAGYNRWGVGDRVAINHHVPCRRSDCFYCSRFAYAQCPIYKRTGTTAGFTPAGGGFSEFVRVMDWCARDGVVAIPDDVGLEEATFIEPLNTCLKGFRSLGIQAGDTVFIVGQGPIGLLFTMLCTTLGAAVVATDLLAGRRLVSESIGATAIDPGAAGSQALDEIARLSNGRGADAAIVAVPSTAVIHEAFRAVRPAGKVLLFAQTRMNDLVKVDAGDICMLEKSLLGSYSSDIDLQQEAADLIFTRKIDVRGLITHRFPLDRIQDAVEMANSPRDGSLKVLVTCNPE